MESKVTDVVIASQDALVAGDLETYLSLLAEDVVGNEAGTELVGKEAVKKHIQSLFAAFKTIMFEERKLFPVGQKVAMKFTLRLTSHAGRQGTLEGVDVFELNDKNQICGLTSFFNGADLAPLFAP